MNTLVFISNQKLKAGILIFFLILGILFQSFSAHSSESVPKDNSKKTMTSFDWEIADILPLEFLMHLATKENSDKSLAEIVELKVLMALPTNEEAIEEKE